MGYSSRDGTLYCCGARPSRSEKRPHRAASGEPKEREGGESETLGLEEGCRLRPTTINIRAS